MKDPHASGKGVGVYCCLWGSLDDLNRRGLGNRDIGKRAWSTGHYRPIDSRSTSCRTGMALVPRRKPGTGVTRSTAAWSVAV
jgi:hypothetical protein